MSNWEWWSVILKIDFDSGNELLVQSTQAQQLLHTKPGTKWCSCGMCIIYAVFACIKNASKINGYGSILLDGKLRVKKIPVHCTLSERKKKHITRLYKQSYKRKQIFIYLLWVVTYTLSEWHGTIKLPDAMCYRPTILNLFENFHEWFSSEVEFVVFGAFFGDSQNCMKFWI